ncbi:MAG: pyruvate kinase [Gammaproteobacteria bacterium]|jgi:pyruvate kinase
MPRRTKIVATLGPATDEKDVLDDMIRAGMDVVRVNFSHGEPDEHMHRAEQVRNRARAHGHQVGVLADLQGPKIRIGRFREDRIFLDKDKNFILDTGHDLDAGTRERVGLTYAGLADDVRRGDTLLLDDGRVVLWVDDVIGTEVRCRVVVGGELTNSKGINRQGGGLSAEAITVKDRRDIAIAADMKADYVAVSFVRAAEDIHLARELLREAGGHGGIVAKIERAEALDALEEIMGAADAIMIARGDLGVEIGDAELPAVQKRIIDVARSRDRVVITATQMMQSMIENQIPTRAEVFDVANAVIEGTDAVMLSAETAIGRYPARVIEAMDRICAGAERQRITRTPQRRTQIRFKRVDEAIAKATMYTANSLGVKAIAALTESGATPLWMSRIRSGIPIYALTRHVDTRRKVTLYRGVYPVSFDVTSTDHAEVNREAIDELMRRGAVRDDDLVIITKGDLVGVHGGTNAMKIIRVGEHEISGA